MTVYNLNSQNSSLHTSSSSFSKYGTNYINVSASGTSIYLDSIQAASSGTQVYINQSNNADFSIEIGSGNISSDSTVVYNKTTDITIINYDTTDGKSISFRIVGDSLNLGSSIEAGAHYVQKNLTDVVPQSGGYYEITACFLAGTLISTVSGDVRVEDIQEGDILNTWSDAGGAPVARKVVWAGKSHAVVRPLPHEDEAGYPVRVLKDAIAPAVPAQDMLVTAEHCLYLDGGFVPVRMLVNGRSIFYDRSILSYDYYHIETENHAIIMADGVLTESYLDTGDRHSFRQVAGAARIGSRGLRWERDAAAPLKTDSASVEPIYRRIEARAVECDVPMHAALPVLTHDADLHLVTESGQVIRESRQVDGYTAFRLPSGVKSVRIVSRTSRPSDVMGVFVDDRRALGVAIGEIKLFDSGKPHVLTSHLTETELSGWQCRDAEGARWTDGNALLSFEGHETGAFAQLAVRILAGGPYRLAEVAGADDVQTA